MENTKGKTRKKSTATTVEEPVRTEHYNTWGYQDSNEVAAEIMNGIHSSLLQGYYVFAYRGTGDIRRLVVTRRDQDTWMYGMITTGWTCLVPRISREGLLAAVVPDLESKKVGKDIIEDFKYWIEQ